MIETVTQWDAALLLWINGHHTHFLDQLMLFASDKATWIPFYLFLLYFIIKEKGRGTLMGLLFVAAVITLSDQTSVHAFKFVFHRLRPCHDPALQGLVRTIEHHCGGSYGFISSHAANSFALIGFISVAVHQMPKWSYTALWFWGVLIIYSRVYLGVHFPLDVLTGATVGMALGLATGKLYQRTENILCKSNKSSRL